MITAGVWGAGREGQSAARKLLAEGYDVVVVEERNAERPADLDERATFVSGTNALTHLISRDLVVTSPGVARTHPFREQLDPAKVTTLTALWMNVVGERTIGVTGTKGKSTTSTLVSLLLAEAGVEVQLGGNIGIPLAELDPARDVTVAEMSSYQCAYLVTAPRVSIITSLYEDHLPWHGGKAQYWRDKANIMGAGCEAVVLGEQTRAKLEAVGIPLAPTVLTPDAALLARLDEVPFAGSLALAQNRANFALAVAAVDYWLDRKLTRAELSAVATSYEPLPHRLSTVLERAGVTWIDDTLSTIPESVAAALESVDGHAILLLGGEERGVDYTPLTKALLAKSPLPTLIALPTNGERIVAEYAAQHPTLVHSAASVAAAVALAAQLARQDTVVLLSPGAPSYDFYKNFEAKSAAFADAVYALE